MMILPAVFDEMVAAAVPKSTAVAEVRFVPVIVTLVPPAGSPDEGAIEVIVGTPAAAAGDTPTKVNATPRVPRHRASASAPFTKRTELTTNVSSQRLVTALLPLASRPADCTPPPLRLERNRFRETAPPPRQITQLIRPVTVSRLTTDCQRR